MRFARVRWTDMSDNRPLQSTRGRVPASGVGEVQQVCGVAGARPGVAGDTRCCERCRREVRLCASGRRMLALLPCTASSAVKNVSTRQHIGQKQHCSVQRSQTPAQYILQDAQRTCDEAPACTS